MPKHDKPLVEDVDYIVVNDNPSFRVTYGYAQGEMRRSTKAIEVYAPALSMEDTVFLCRECKAYTAANVGGIHSHQRMHSAKVKTDQAVGMEQARRIVAFNLLPEKMQASLLKQADAILKGGK